MMRARHLILAILALTVLAEFGSPVCAQRPRPDHRREYLKSLSTALGEQAETLGPDKVRKMVAIARQVLRRIDGRELERIRKLPLDQQVKALVDEHRRQREAAERRFLARLAPERRAELEALAPLDRARRIQAMQAGATLERAIAMAAGHDLVDDDEIARLRTLEPKKQLEAAFDLHRRLFMLVHGDQLGEAERKRLLGLDERRFWRDDAVRRFRLQGRISRSEIRAIKKLDEKERARLLGALRRGKALDDFVERGVIDAESARRWTALDRRGRGRLLRVLERAHLSHRDRSFAPMILMRHLPREKRREFFRVPREQRLDWLKQQVDAETWKKIEARLAALERIRPALDRLEPGQRGLLVGVMPEVARERLSSLAEPGESERVDALMKDLEAAGWFDHAVPLRREARRLLNAEERAKLDGMGPIERADFLFQRCPEIYEADLNERLEKAGFQPPEGWASWSGSRKLAHANRLGIRLRREMGRSGPRGRRFGPERGREARDRGGRSGRRSRPRPPRDEPRKKPGEGLR